MQQRPRKQSKIASQRQYRVKEEGGFQELRDTICQVTGEAPQTRRETLKKAAELLRQLSTEGIISGHELHQVVEDPSPSSYEFIQNAQPESSYENIFSDDIWTDPSLNMLWESNTSPIVDQSAMNSMLEYHSYPQAEVCDMMGGDWDLFQPTPLQYQQPAPWDGLTFIHSNIDPIPFFFGESSTETGCNSEFVTSL